MQDTITFHDSEDYKNLIKGRLDDAFSYGSNALIVSKKGSEISTKLEEICTKLETRKQAYMIQLAVKLKSCGAIPTENAYYEDDLEEIKSCIPKKFKYGMCRSSVSEVSEKQSYTAVTEGGDTSNTHNSTACEEYNGMVYRLRNLCREISTATSLKNGINPKENYKLNVNQISALGF